MMAGACMKQFIHELKREAEMSGLNDWALRRAIDQGKSSALLDMYNDACGMTPFPKLDIGAVPQIDPLTGLTIPSEPYKAPEPRVGTERTRQTDEKVSDPVNQPAHYTGHPAGIECIQVTEHMGFNIGNAVKYLWRCDLKNDAIEDLEKAEWYIRREIQKRKKVAA
jgi:hypothetical protein